MARAARRVLRCFVDWGVLQDTKEKGVYQSTPPQLIQDQKLVAWLVEATLAAKDSDVSTLNAIAHSPALFPFAIGQLKPTDLKGNERLELFRQGLDENMITNRQSRITTHPLVEQGS